MLSKGNILVVDDEINLCRILDAKLTKSGYEVMTVHDGLQAVEKVQETQFDLVLLDLILPKLDGLEALAKIRKINSELPVIIMTACENTDAVSRALAEGASGFVSKPFDLDRLVMLVQNTSSEGRSVSTETTVKASSGVFRAGQEARLVTADDTSGGALAKVVGRSSSLLTVSLSSKDTFPVHVGEAIAVHIPAPDALYKFTTSVREIEAEELTLDLPQVMYRVQRRRFQRVQLKAPVVFSEPSANAEKSGYTEDIGPCGMSIVAAQPVAVGQSVEVEAKAILHLEKVNCRGVVTRCSKIDRAGREQYRMAVEFSEPDPVLRRALLQHFVNE